MSSAKQMAARIKLKNDFETSLIEVYVKGADLLTEDEICEVINRFAARILPSGRG